MLREFHVLEQYFDPNANQIGFYNPNNDILNQNNINQNNNNGIVNSNNGVVSSGDGNGGGGGGIVNNSGGDGGEEIEEGVFKFIDGNGNITYKDAGGNYISYNEGGDGDGTGNQAVYDEATDPIFGNQDGVTTTTTGGQDGKKGLGGLFSFMTDDKGLFQGGEQGRLFGRVRDRLDGLFGIGNNNNEDMPETTTTTTTPALTKEQLELQEQQKKLKQRKLGGAFSGVSNAFSNFNQGNSYDYQGF